ncbi:MAG: DUF6493 family protein [Capnocytophaga sp.]|nr:DUF6493 family protein [Capnocytophaga sp.]
MQTLLTLIAECDFEAILQHNAALSDTQRSQAIELLKPIDPYKDEDLPLLEVPQKEYWGYKKRVNDAYHLALISLVRNEKDYEQAQILRKYNDYTDEKNPYFEALNNTHFQYFINYFEQFSPEKYIKTLLKDVKQDGDYLLGFPMMWYFYQKGWLKFDEAIFVRKLLEIPMYMRSTKADADFLFQNPEAIEKVLLQLYRIETKVLDLSKWEGDPNRKTNDLGAAKVTTYWDEVFALLQEKGYQIPRSFISQLFESLLNPWKKPHLDWHCRLIDFFQPTKAEVLENQQNLFAVLSLGNVSLINFAIEKIKGIYQDQTFDYQSFLDNFTLAFTTEKATKSLLVGLGIVEQIFAKNPPENALAEPFAVLLMNPDAKLQNATAEILVKFFQRDDLQAIIPQFEVYLKEKSKDIFTQNNILGAEPSQVLSAEISVENQAVSIENYPEIAYPQNWDELLFRIGDCIRDKKPADIDVLLHSFIHLQKAFPTDLATQLKPYQKQLFKDWGDIYSMPILKATLQGLVEKKNISVQYSEKEWTKLNKMPYGKEYEAFRTDLLMRKRLSYARENLSPLFHKAQLVVEKVISGDDLPFVSTPTHQPFYVSAKALVERLLAYEHTEKQPNTEDLILACNRMLPVISEEDKALAKTLKGDYAKAINYYLGNSDKVEPSADLMPLWTQITRIKHPNGDFSKDFPEEIAQIPAVGEPLYFDVKIEEDQDWISLNIDDINHRYKPIKKLKYSQLYYNSGNYKRVTRSDIAYMLSCNPHYLDGMLCAYVPDSFILTEVPEQERMLYPMQFLVENGLKVYHSGWVYVAAGLLFEKKPQRDLASEFVLQALGRGDDLGYLAELVGRLLAGEYAPVNRFVEYLDRVLPYGGVKAFQREALEQFFRHLDPDNQPTNTKKLITYLNEISAQTQPISADIAEKIAGLGKKKK